MKRVLFGIVGALALCTTAMATEWLYWPGSSTGLGLGRTGAVSGRDTYYTTGSGAIYSHGSGLSVKQIRVKYGTSANSSTTPTTYGSLFNTYCISPTEILASPSNPYIINTPTQYNGGNTMSDLDRIARLTSLNDTAVAGANNAFDFLTSNTTNNDICAAFQLALWNIVQDNDSFTSHNFNPSGFFTMGGAVENNIESYFNAFMGIANDTTKTGSMIMFYPNPLTGSQILITNTVPGGGGFTPTPEPFTMSLGLAAAAAFVRRRIKAKA